MKVHAAEDSYFQISYLRKTVSLVHTLMEDIIHKILSHLNKAQCKEEFRWWAQGQIWHTSQLEENNYNREYLLLRERQSELDNIKLKSHQHNSKE